MSCFSEKKNSRKVIILSCELYYHSKLYHDILSIKSHHLYSGINIEDIDMCEQNLTCACGQIILIIYDALSSSYESVFN